MGTTTSSCDGGSGAAAIGRSRPAPPSVTRFTWARSARSRRAASVTERWITDSGSWRPAIWAAISARVRCASERWRSSSYRRALVIATAACPAKSWTSSKSFSVKPTRGPPMRPMFMAPITSSPAMSGTMTIASSSTGVPGICTTRGSSSASLRSTGSRCSTLHQVRPWPRGIGKPSTASALRSRARTGASTSASVSIRYTARLSYSTTSLSPSATRSSTPRGSRVERSCWLMSSRRRCESMRRASAADCSRRLASRRSRSLTSRTDPWAPANSPSTMVGSIRISAGTT